MFKFFNITSLCALTLAFAPYAMAQPAKSANAPAKRASWIALNVQTDKEQYAAGEPIKVTLKATNIQSRDAYLKFSSGQRFDLKLFRVGDSEPVYTWSANKMFTMATAHVKLKQGESETYDAEMGDEMGALKAGTYRLKAQLSNSSQISAAPIVFKIVPRAASTDVQKATLTATTDKSVYNLGEEVKVDCTLHNNAKSPTTFNFNSGQTYDVFIRNAAGEVVWNWAANKRFLMVSRPITLAAGEKQNFSVQWDGRALPDAQVTPGKYTVQAIYASTPEVAAAPIVIEIR